MIFLCGLNIFYLLVSYCIGVHGEFSFEYVSPDGAYAPNEEIHLISVVSGGSFTESDNWKICKWMNGPNICEFQYICKGLGCAIGLGTWSHKQSCTPDFQDLKIIHNDAKGETNTICGVIVPSGTYELHHGNWTVSVNQCVALGCQNGVSSHWIEETIDVSIH